MEAYGVGEQIESVDELLRQTWVFLRLPDRGLILEHVGCIESWLLSVVVFHIKKGRFYKAIKE